MSSVVAKELRGLRKAFEAIDGFLEKTQCPVARESLRKQLLEVVSHKLGDLPVYDWWAHYGNRPAAGNAKALFEVAGIISDVSAHAFPEDPRFAMPFLANPELDLVARKSSGVYFTDSRLARYLVNSIESELLGEGAIFDPAVGSGMLLVAAVKRLVDASGEACADVIRRRAFGADVSAEGVWAAKLSLATMCSGAVDFDRLDHNVRQHDSLLEHDQQWGQDLQSIQVVLSNPPWERVRLTRHEFLKGAGDQRKYGAHYDEASLSGYQMEKRSVSEYAAALKERYNLCGSGEPDLAACFLELGMRLAGEHGAMAYIVPGSLIRSQGMAALRRELIMPGKLCSAHVFDNKSRYFGIDTRTKFLVFTRVNAERPSGVLMHHAREMHGVPEPGPGVKLGKGTLKRLGDDLLVPELRTQAEAELFGRIVRDGQSFEDAFGDARFSREVDMTNHRSLFRKMRAGLLPVIEGRMIQQFHFPAKSHLSGTGRAARWVAIPPGASGGRAQFGIERSDIPCSVDHRSNRARVGFCDVTGQTNERSIIATLIPPNVVCGNKVPTLLFSGSDDLHKALALVGLMNSFVFDWLARRLITTSVNYFILKQIPVPAANDLAGLVDELAGHSAKLVGAEGHSLVTDLSERAMLRAEIDVKVAAAYGLDRNDLELIMSDFPLIDRRSKSCAETARLSTPGFLWHAWGARFDDRSNAGPSDGCPTLPNLGYVPSEALSKWMG